MENIYWEYTLQGEIPNSVELKTQLRGKQLGKQFQNNLLPEPKQ